MTQRLQPPRSHVVSRACLTGALAFANACSATPVPEPPDLQPDVHLFNTEGAADTIASGYGAELHGDAGAACPSCSLRITDIDTQQPTVTTTVAADGSFRVMVPGLAEGHWLRIETLAADRGATTLDVVFTAVGVTVPELPNCIRATPQVELTFSGSGAAQTRQIQLTNSCSSVITVTNAHLRLGSRGYQTIAVPTSIDPGAQASITVDGAAASGIAVEDHLVFDATLGGQAFRLVWTLKTP